MKGNFSERQFYKKYANKLTRLKNLSKKTYYKKALNVNKSNSKELSKLINSVILNKRANNPTVKKLTVNNVDFEEPEGISEQFNKFFVEIGHEITNNANSETSNDNFRTYLTKLVNSTIVFDPSNSLEIYNAINALNPHKSCGYDDISATFLRLDNEVLAPFLTAYFEIVLEFVFFSQIFKTAQVIPVFRTGKRNLNNNYRPISLLSSLSKVLEKLIKIRLLKFFDKHQVLYENQYGFRKKVQHTACLTGCYIGDIQCNPKKSSHSTYVYRPPHGI